LVEKKVYKGTISSVILSVVVLVLLITPLLVANRIQDIREGKGKYAFKETLCYDINREDQFLNDHDYPRDCGEGALVYGYYDDEYNLFWSYSTIILMDYLLNGTLDGYGAGIAKTCEPFNPPVRLSVMYIYMDLTKEDIIEKDITRMDIYFDITGKENFSYRVLIEDYEIGVVAMGKLTQLKIDVYDLFEINNLPEDVPLTFSFIPTADFDESRLYPDEGVIFDMQMYCIEEIKVPSLEKLGFWMIGISLFMLFCSVLMLPEVSFEWIINRIMKRDD